MEERWKWYLAGAIDTAGRIDMKVAKDSDYSIGYVIYPQITLSRTGQYDAIFGMLDEYCEDNNVKYRIDEHGETKRFTVEREQNVKRFLEPLFPRFIQQIEPTQIIFEEIIPIMEEGKHTEENGFLEIMEHVEELRSHLPKASRESKYDLEYFEKEFSE